MTRTVTTLLFVYNDTTAQKKKSDEIEQLRHRSETIVQQNPMPIILVDMNFHIRVVNEAYARLSGIGRSESAQDDPPRFQDPGPERGRIKTGDPGEETDGRRSPCRVSPRCKTPAAVWYSYPGQQR